MNIETPLEYFHKFLIKYQIEQSQKSKTFFNKLLHSLKIKFSSDYYDISKLFDIFKDSIEQNSIKKCTSKLIIWLTALLASSKCKLVENLVS